MNLTAATIAFVFGAATLLINGLLVADGLGKISRTTLNEQPWKSFLKGIAVGK